MYGVSKATSKEIVGFHDRVKVSAQLIRARRNAAFLVIILYIQDLFWILASRIAYSYGEFPYRVVEWDWVSFVKFVELSGSFSVIGACFVLWMKPIRKIWVEQGTVLSIIGIAITLNVIGFMLLDPDARYVSGGRTGINGLVYFFGLAFTLASMVIILRQNAGNKPLPRIWTYGFIISYALTIDGLARALTLALFMFIYWKIRLTRPKHLILIATIAGILGVVGFAEKFSQLPGYFTPGFFVNWVVGRFSIQAEQLFRYLSGESVLNSTVGYWELIGRSIENRAEVVLSGITAFEYPRNIAEALYYDMFGNYGSGSSPGLLLGSVLLGPMAIIMPALYAFIFIQFFYEYHEKISLVQACAYSFLFKGIHANNWEIFVVVSPTLLYIVFILGASILMMKEDYHSKVISSFTESKKWRISN